MANYYNEIDPYAAQWLRNLIDAKHIAPQVAQTVIEAYLETYPKEKHYFQARVGVAYKSIA